MYPYVDTLDVTFNGTRRDCFLSFPWDQGPAQVFARTLVLASFHSHYVGPPAKLPILVPLRRLIDTAVAVTFCSSPSGKQMAVQDALLEASARAACSPTGASMMSIWLV